MDKSSFWDKEYDISSITTTALNKNDRIAHTLR